jgi:hypothetical protein
MAGVDLELNSQLIPKPMPFLPASRWDTRLLGMWSNAPAHVCALAYRRKAELRALSTISDQSRHLRGVLDPDQYVAFEATLDSSRDSHGNTQMTTPVPSRRRFLIHAAMATAALPLAMRMIGDAHAGALTKLPPDNAQAKALGYVEDASTSKNASFKPGSACANCHFFTAASGACSLFAGFTVSPKGWCSAWARKPA